MVMIEATYIDHMGSDLSVVNAARVSFGKESEFTDLCHNCGDRAVEKYWSINLWECKSCFIDISQEDMKLSDRDTKLIKYLAKHKHLSPFGHAFASFHVKCPLFVHAQLVKHKFLRVNTISRRYVDDNIEFYVPDVWRRRSADKKQGSSNDEVKEILVEGWKMEYPDHLKDTMEVSDAYDSVVNEATLCLYKDMIHAGVAPEMARMVLPQSLMTEFIWSGSLDAFAAMCKLRCASDTQYESRIVADQISAKMGELFPVSWAALMKGEK
jgi:thymidylate synthase (FAD)